MGNLTCALITKLLTIVYYCVGRSDCLEELGKVRHRDAGIAGLITAAGVDKKRGVASRLQASAAAGRTRCAEAVQLRCRSSKRASRGWSKPCQQWHWPDKKDCRALQHCALAALQSGWDTILSSCAAHGRSVQVSVVHDSLTSQQGRTG